MFLHAQEGDEFGNVRHFGSVFCDKLLAKAARRAVVVSVDRLISNDEVRAQPARDDDPELSRHARRATRPAARARAPATGSTTWTRRRSAVSTRELMACVLATHLRDGEIVIIGGASPVPMAAALLAQLTHAPNLTLLTGSGAVNPRPSRLALSGGDYVYVESAEAYFTMEDVFDDTERGRWDVGIFGGIQVDRHGNFNLTFVGGTLEAPGVPWSGTGERRAAADGASARCCASSATRRRCSWRPSTSRRASGNGVCVTDLAILDFSDDAALVSVHPGRRRLDACAPAPASRSRASRRVTTSPPRADRERCGTVDPTGVLA